MNPETQLEILVDKLRLPTPVALEPWLRKLLTNPGSVVIIAIEFPLHEDGPHIGTAWLSESERVKVRKALLAINKSRCKLGEAQTNEIPTLD